MAVCPKCGKKLHIYNWRPECPQCGVNLIYYKANDILLEESEKAEIEHAKHQPGIDRAKASTIGSKFGVARIVLSVLPLASLMLPLVGTDSKPSVNAIGVYKYISEIGIGSVFSNALSDKTSLSIALVMLSIVSLLVIGILSVMSLGKHGKQRNLILNIYQVVLAAGAAVSFASGGGKLKIGAFVYVALFVALLVYNLIIAKKGIPVKYTTCYIGGLPSDEYFKMVESGMSQLEIRKKMITALKEMEAKVKKEAAEAEEKAQAERAKWK